MIPNLNSFAIPPHRKTAAELDLEDEMGQNAFIAWIGLIPFVTLFITFIVILCKRKIEDFYLKWLIIILFASLLLRILMSGIAAIMLKAALANLSNGEMSDRLLALKLQTVEFSLPYYFYLMVTVTITFSAL